MTDAGGSRSFKGRSALRLLLPVTFCAMLALPLALVLTWGRGGPAYATVLRIFALEAFTLIFVSIVTGSQTRLLYRLFKPKRAYRFHIDCGAAGFTLALAHGVIVLSERFFGGFSSLWVIGPVVLGCLMVTIFAALDKRRLVRIWRRIHQINYVLFVAILVKALAIGTDLKGPLAYTVVLRAIFIVYAVVAAAATAGRVWQHEVDERRRQARATAT